MRLLGLARISKEKDAGHSLEIQDKLLRGYCDLYGHELVEVVIADGVSAGEPFFKRADGAEIRERLLDGEADGFVGVELDRVFRNTIDGLMTVAWFDEKGFEIHLVEDKIDTSDPDGYFLLTIKLGLAQRERHKVQQRNRRISKGLRDSSRAWGPTPWGCVRIGDRIFRDPCVWPTRVLMVSLSEDRGLSLRKICSSMQQSHILNPSGGKLWHVSTVRGILETHHDLEHIPPLPEGEETQVSYLAMVK